MSRQDLYDLLNENKGCMFSLDLISIRFGMERHNISTKMTKLKGDIDWEFLKEGKSTSKIFFFIANDINK